jgi:hypothetical protein
MLFLLYYLESKEALCIRCTAVGIFTVVHFSFPNPKIRKNIWVHLLRNQNTLFFSFALCLKCAEDHYENVAVLCLCFKGFYSEKKVLLGLSRKTYRFL